MEKVLELSEKDPNVAIVYILLVAVVALSSAVVYLFKDRQKQEVKNFDMLIRSIEALKDNANLLDRVKEKLDILLRKHG